VKRSRSLKQFTLTTARAPAATTETVREGVCKPAREEFAHGDDVIAKRFGLFEDALDVGRAADADMIRQ
jgi:hypothetical protein